MIRRTLRQLQTVDERTQIFTPFGLGVTHVLTPDATVAYQYNILSGTDLVDDVPDGVRLAFERVRTTFVEGALNYDQFTNAENLARLETEHALRDRFLSYYDNSIPLVNDRNEERVEAVASYEDVMTILKRRSMRPRRGRPAEWRLKLPKSGSAMEFNGMLTHLWTWARKEGSAPRTEGTHTAAVPGQPPQRCRAPAPLPPQQPR